MCVVFLVLVVVVLIWCLVFKLKKKKNLKKRELVKNKVK